MALSSARAAKEPHAVRLGRMASVKVNAFQKAMEHLRNMFPEAPKAMLEDALKSADVRLSGMQKGWRLRLMRLTLPPRSLSHFGKG